MGLSCSVFSKKVVKLCHEIPLNSVKAELINHCCQFYWWRFGGIYLYYNKAFFSFINIMRDKKSANILNSNAGGCLVANLSNDVRIYLWKDCRPGIWHHFWQVDNGILKRRFHHSGWFEKFDNESQCTSLMKAMAMSNPSVAAQPSVAVDHTSSGNYKHSVNQLYGKHHCLNTPTVMFLLIPMFWHIIFTWNRCL